MYRPTCHLKLTRPISPGMEEPSIVQAQKELEKFHMKAQGTSNIEERRKYQDNRNPYKKTIKRKIFCSQSAILEKFLNYETQ